MKQQWMCEVCGLSGAIEYSDGAGVMEVVHALESHHDRLASEHAPYCRFDTHRVRVKSDDMDIYEWNRLVARHEQGRLHG